MDDLLHSRILTNRMYILRILSSNFEEVNLENKQQFHFGIFNFWKSSDYMLYDSPNWAENCHPTV